MKKMILLSAIVAVAMCFTSSFVQAGLIGSVPSSSLPGDVDGDSDVDFDDAASIDSSTSFDDAFTLINNYGGGALVTTLGSITNSKMTIGYNPANGNMQILDGFSGSLNKFKSVRIKSTVPGFTPGVANWIGQDYTVVQNLATDQGFSTATGLGDTFLPQAVYNIGNIYAPNKTLAQLLAELTITYGIEGVVGTLTGDIVIIPEPSSMALLGMGLVGLVAARRRRAA